MRMNLIKILTSIILVVVAFVACDKAPLRSIVVEMPEGKALVRFALLSAGTPAVMIKANDVKLNGNTTLGSGGFFPSTTSSPDYAAVIPGSTIKLALPFAGTQNDSIVLFNSNLDVQAGKKYSVTLTDTGINRTAFAIEDQFLTTTQDSMLSVRLINAMVGSTVNFIRVDSLTPTDVVRDTLARNIPYKGTSGFIQVKTFARNPVSGFIRIRIATTDGRVLGVSQIPPQTPTTGSRRSITYYAYNFVNGTGIYAPTLSGHVTNQ